MTLDDLRPGDRARVVALLTDPATKRCLMAMGIIKGVEVFMIKTAPLGGPVEVMVRGHRLNLQKHETSGIEICAF